MEYFIGSTVSAVIIITLVFLLRRIPKPDKTFFVNDSQSYKYASIGVFLDAQNGTTNKREESQSTKHYESIFVKMVIVNEKAYWIKDNKVFIANVVDDQVDEESAKEVDMMGMDQVQLKEMLFIVDKLKEK